MQKLLFILLITCAACNEQSTEQVSVGQDSMPDTMIVEKNEDIKKIDSTLSGEAALKLTPMDMAGDLGRVTFSQKDLTVFYFDHKTKKGEIVLNKRKHILDRYSYNSKKETYEISNKDIRIVTGHCAFNENVTTDCCYGRIKEVKISSEDGELILNNVDVQDCPLD